MQTALDIRKINSEPLKRSLSVEVKASGDDELEFSFSSEQPCERWWGTEILSHEPSAPNLERLGGMNLLWNHKADVVLGKVTEISFKDKRGYCKIRWSKKDSIKEYRQDVEDGIITNVSFMYSVDEIKAEDMDADEYLVTRWTIYEISFVSIPADHTVGVGRSKVFSISEVPFVNETLEKPESDAGLQEKQRASRILGLAKLCAEKTANKEPIYDLAQQLIHDGDSIDSASEKLLRKLGSDPQSPIAAAIDPLSGGLSEKEKRQYSLVKLIRSLDPNFPEYKERLTGKNSLEKEISDAIAAKTGRSTEGLYVPYNYLAYGKEQRDILNTGTGASGGYTVSTELSSEFIEILRNEAKVLSLGATIYSGLEGFVDFAKQNLAAAFGWVGENGELPDTDIGYELISLSPKDFGGIISYTRRLLMQSSFSVELQVRNELATGMGLAMDYAILWGTGTNNQPLGIFNRPVQSVALGNDGAAPTYAKLIELRRNVKRARKGNNVALQCLTNASVEAKLMLTPLQASGVEGNFILPPNGDRLMGMPFHTTEQVRDDLTKGNGTGLSGFVMGYFPDVMIGMWDVLEIKLNDQGRTFKSGGVEIRAMQTMDVNLRYNESFGVITDIVTTI